MRGQAQPVLFGSGTVTMIIIDVMNTSDLNIWNKYEQVLILYIFSPSHHKSVKKAKPENEGWIVFNFPVWTENDILEAGGLLGLNIEEVKTRYAKFGGIPRYCFESEHQNNRDLDTAIAKVTVDSLSRCGTDTDQNYSHIIFQRVMVDINDLLRCDLLLQLYVRESINI